MPNPAWGGLAIQHIQKEQRRTRWVRWTIGILIVAAILAWMMA
ncbi:MAG: hypothetical protein V3R16_02540 [Nitrospirales bacterium]